MGLRLPENEEIVENPPVEKDPPAEPTPPVEGAGEGEEDPPPVEEDEVPEFVPNYKFSVLDKEHEVPEKFRSLITDEETQKEVVEIFEKSMGLDHIKEKYGVSKTRVGELEKQYADVESGVKDLRSHVESGDYAAFFSRMGIPVENVLQWVIDRVNYQEMSPEEKSQVDRQKAAQFQLQDAQTSANQVRDEMTQRLDQAKANELRSVFKEPQIVDFQKQYDEQLGKAGAFKSAVLDEGELAWQLHKEEISGEEAVRRLMARSGVLLGTTIPTNTTTQTTVNTQQTATTVIPNVSGKNQSTPVKEPMKSIDDLRKRYREL